jgi:hypothetical protein
MRRALFIVATCTCLVAPHTSAASTPVPPPELQKVGDCAITTITRITARIEGTSPHDTGSAIRYANGVAGVSYEYVPPLHASHIGDQARLCLVSIFKSYPPGDDAGQEYQATNLRTGNHWASGYKSDYIRQIASYYGVDANALAGRLRAPLFAKFQNQRVSKERRAHNPCRHPSRAFAIPMAQSTTCTTTRLRGSTMTVRSFTIA